MFMNQDQDAVTAIITCSTMDNIPGWQLPISTKTPPSFSHDNYISLFPESPALYLCKAISSQSTNIQM